jgi:sugar lactone lactonase YvrE
MGVVTGTGIAVTVETTVESSADFTTAGATTHHHLVIDKPPFAAGGSLELEAEGWFGTGSEWAQARVAGDFQVSVSNAGRECVPVHGTQSISASDLLAWTAGASVDVDVMNSILVPPNCPVNRHTVRLQYDTPATRLDFGEVRTDAEKTILITIRNQDPVDRTVLESSNAAAFVPGEASILLPPMSAIQTIVRFVPSSLGPVAGDLTIVGNLPGDVAVHVNLAGIGIAPPTVQIAPDTLTAVLPVGGAQDQPITIGNPGSRALDLDLRVEGPEEPGPQWIVVLDGGPLSLVAINLNTGETRRTILPQSLSGARAVAIAPSGDRAFIATYYNGLYVMDLPAGEMTLVADGISGITDLVLSQDGAGAYLLDEIHGTVVRVDLGNGSKQVVATGLSAPVALALSASNHEMFIAEFDRLLKANFENGVVTPTVAGLGGVTSLAVDEAHGFAYFTSYSSGLGRVDLATGLKTTVAVDDQTWLNGVSLSSGGRQAFVLEPDQGRVVRVDFACGVQTPMFSGLTSPRDMAIRTFDSSVANFLLISPALGTVEPSAALALTARFSAANLSPGDYGAAVVVREAGVEAPIAKIPARLLVVSSPHLVHSRARSIEVTRVGGPDIYSDTIVSLNLPVLDTPQGPGVLDITTEASLSQDARVSVEGQFLGLNPKVQCVPTTASYPLSEGMLQELTSDGVIEVELGLHRLEDLGVSCGIQRFSARLTYPGSADSVDFGTLESGQMKTIRLGLSNEGDQSLILSGFGLTGEGYSATQTDVILDPGARLDLDLTFSAGSVGTIHGALSFVTNEPGIPSVEIALVAAVVNPPGISVHPAALSAEIVEGSSISTSLSLLNGGGFALEYSLRLPALAEDNGTFTQCPPKSILTSRLLSLDLETGEGTQLLKPLLGSGAILDLTLDTAGSTAFISRGSGSGGVDEVDLATGAIRLLAGFGTAPGVALSPDEQTLYFTAGALHSVNRRTLELMRIGNIEQGEGIALNRSGRSAFVTSGSGELVEVDLATGAMRTVTNGLHVPQGIRLTSDESSAYVVEMVTAPFDFTGGRLVRVDLTSGSIVPVMTGLVGAESLLLDPTGTTAYVGEDAGFRIQAVDLAAGESTVFADGVAPYGMAFRPSAECSGRYVGIPNRTGEIAPMTAGDVPLKIDAGALAPGTYQTTLEILSNDPLRPTVMVPITVRVLPDHDKDGVDDANDNCPARANADQADGDGDRVGDVCDDCPAVADPGQADSNGDGAGDACQARAEVVAIRQDGGQFLEVQAHISDPQNAALAGTVTIAPAAGTGAAAGSGAVAETGAALTTVRGGAPIVLIPFVGRLPRTIDLASLTPAASYRLTISVTNGNTPAFTAAGDFRFQGEPQLAFDDPPVAGLSLPATIECNRPGGAAVALSGAGSLDPDSTPGTRDDIRSYAWILDPGSPGEASLGTGEALDATIPLGAHTIALRVTDSIGESGQAGVVVMVVDTTPPVATLTVDPAVLFPPNHTMRQVRLVWQVVDACDPAPAVTLLSAGSSEPDDAAGEGDGQTTGDVQAPVPGPAPAAIGLRAERSGAGGGRVYEVRAQVSDASGNTTPAATSIVVPHDQGQSPEPLILRLQRLAGGGAGVWISWTGLAEAEGYDVIAGDLAAWRADGGLLRLGSVRVLARGITLTTVQEPAIAPAPAVGHAFFYLVQQRVAGAGAGYGTVSAARPRVPDSCLGGCP